MPSAPAVEIKCPIKALVVVHSFTGVTLLLARQIADVFSAPLIHLRETPPEGTFGAPADPAQRLNPEPEVAAVDPAAYQLVFVGSPIWNMAPTDRLRRFVASHSFSGAQVVLIHSFSALYEERYLQELEQLIRDRGGRPIGRLLVRVDRGMTPPALSDYARREIIPLLPAWTANFLPPEIPTAELIHVPPPHDADQLLIPAGTTWLGCFNPGECFAGSAPPRLAQVESFWIDRTEVTADQYRRCVENGACREPDQTPPCDHWRDHGDWPIRCVSPGQAQDYCRWVGMDLPGETQWIRAARGSRTASFPWGDQWGPPGQYVFYTPRRQDASLSPQAMDQLQPVCSQAGDRSPFGACDLGGGVSEITYADHGLYGYSDLRSDLVSDRFVGKGGSYVDVDPRSFAIGTQHLVVVPGIYFAGFRCVRKL